MFRSVFLPIRVSLRARAYHEAGYRPKNNLQTYSLMKDVKAVSAEEAVKCINSSDNVVIQTAAAAPQQLIKAMTARHAELRNVNVLALHTEGPAPYQDYPESFMLHNFFVGGNVRKTVQAGIGQFIPSFLSEVPRFFREGQWPVDVVLLNVSPPDKHGYVSLGPSVDICLAAAEQAKLIVAQVNPNVPRTHGTSAIHISQIDYCVHVDEPLFGAAPKAPSEVETKIGEYVADLVEDGACLQMGIGGIPNAALANLMDRKDLGIHTEMFSDGLIDLIEQGVVTNARKKLYPGVSIAGFAVGSQRLYDFIDDNPAMQFRDISWVNDTTMIRKNKRATSINSAIEIDLTGQVNSDSIGPKVFSGVGGQIDFVRGSVQSEGGKSIIALPSVTKNGRSRLQPTLVQGAGVVTTRAHLNYVVTEYGVVNVWGRTMSDRAARLIRLAHPDHRESLEKDFFDIYKIMPRIEEH